jgi:hypothetical protein
MSKLLRLTNCTNLILSSALRESKLVRTTIPLRFYTTEPPAQPPKPATPPTTSTLPPKPDATKKEQPGKGKGMKICFWM